MRRINNSLIILFFCLAASLPSFGWGKTGHRVVGRIAEQHLTKKARKNLQSILGNESLAMVSNWMDFIKTDPGWDHANPWHYCTIPDGMTYDQVEIPREGDIIQTLNRVIQELKTKHFADVDELTVLKFLIHLVGDIHQPLHVGNGMDRGGNDVNVRWFRQNSNLHRVWDSGMIDYQQLSYTEMTSSIDFATKAQIAALQDATILDWAYEAMALRNRVYDLPEDNKLSYRYVFDNWAIVENQLLKAGIRLAGILNDIYG